jgi:hypothetical protein
VFGTVIQGRAGVFLDDKFTSGVLKTFFNNFGILIVDFLVKRKVFLLLFFNLLHHNYIFLTQKVQNWNPNIAQKRF